MLALAASGLFAVPFGLLLVFTMPCGSEVDAASVNMFFVLAVECVAFVVVFFIIKSLAHPLLVVIYLFSGGIMTDNVSSGSTWMSARICGVIGTMLLWTDPAVWSCGNQISNSPLDTKHCNEPSMR